MSSPGSLRLTTTVVILPLISSALAISRSRGDALDEIKAKVRTQQAGLVSLRAHIRSWNTRTPTHVVYSVIAASGPGRYERVQHSEFETIEDDPKGWIRLYDGVSFNLFHPYERRYEISHNFATRRYIRKIQTLFLFECLGWWPPGDSSKPLRLGDEPEFLSDIMDDCRCRLYSDVRATDVAECVGVEIPGVVRLWLDPRLGVVRRREQLKRGADGMTRVSGTYDFFEYTSYGEAVWLPRRIERSFPAHDMVLVHIIDSYEVNRGGEGWFAFKPPEGTYVYDRDKDVAWQIPGGLDFLEVVTRRVISGSGSEIVSDRVNFDWCGRFSGVGAFIVGMCGPSILNFMRRRFASGRQVSSVNVLGAKG